MKIPLTSANRPLPIANRLLPIAFVPIPYCPLFFFSAILFAR